MKLENNICLCAYPESKIYVYNIFPEKGLFSRIKQILSVRLFGTYIEMKFVLFSNFLLVHRPFEYEK